MAFAPNGRGGGSRGSKRGSTRAQADRSGPGRPGSQLGFSSPALAPSACGRSASTASSETGGVPGHSGPGEERERRLVRDEELRCRTLGGIELADALVERDVLRGDGSVAEEVGPRLMSAAGQRVGQVASARDRARSRCPPARATGAIASLVLRSKMESTRILAACSGSSNRSARRPKSASPSTSPWYALTHSSSSESSGEKIGAEAGGGSVVRRVGAWRRYRHTPEPSRSRATGPGRRAGVDSVRRDRWPPSCCPSRPSTSTPPRWPSPGRRSAGAGHASSSPRPRAKWARPTT